MKRCVRFVESTILLLSARMRFVCDWEDDGYQRWYPDADGCTNRISPNEASQAVKDMFKETTEESYHPDVGDILLAPSDYGSRRYCTNVDRGLKAEIIGFELLGENGKTAKY
jgi:hypothetical protein